MSCSRCELFQDLTCKHTHAEAMAQHQAHALSMQPSFGPGLALCYGSSQLQGSFAFLMKIFVGKDMSGMLFQQTEVSLAAVSPFPMLSSHCELE